MDYKEKFEDFLDKMKGLLDNAEKQGHIIIRVEDLENTFPELRESEDEKMRKEIISFLQDHIDDINLQVSGDYDTRDKEDIALQEWCKRAITWLEKQGDNNNEDADILQRFSFYSYKDEPNVLYLSNVFVNEEYRNKGIGTKILKIADEVSTYLKCNSIRLKTENGSNAESLYRKNGYKTLKEEGNQVWLEKQGEQKTSVVDFKAKDWYVSKVDGKIYNAKFMEKTPTNQARKLEIEKAAMSATGIIKQEEWFIKGAEWSDKNPSYICSEKQNEQKPTDKIEPKFHEGEWIVWKDKYYKVNYNGCGYELVDQNGLSTSLEYGTIDESAHLWTIQNDAKDGDVLDANGAPFIYKKHDKNYVYYYCGVNLGGEFTVAHGIDAWNSKYKVYPATKEQRDTLFVKMKEEGYEWDAEKKELKKLSQRMISAEVKEALYDKPTDEEMKELLRTEYEKGRADTIAEMKKDWSEEDEVRLQACLDTLQAKSLMGKIDTVMTKWLKSLKDRVILQPKHEWSIEDERVIAIINNALTESNTPPDDYDKVYDWLESLRQRI